ncbi:MAG TPA: mannose-1-phosphate guanylyltransferase [Lachnospiraceae bacterium]|nr:mannose-1-phosphate guanylyltransferase [Lachnospiraceae bacterium]
MNVILLSGGSGQRLWPLSNDVRSKQFINIFKTEDGTYESMVQRVYRQIKSIDKDAVVTIATSKTQISSIHNQLGQDVGISIEPCRRDTFPAIALATAYLHDEQGVNRDETVVVCPVDPFVEDDYFEALKKLSDLADTGRSNLNLLGMEPTYPSTKYGYIIPKTKDDISEVDTFKEKPDEKTAGEYIAKGALWNGGVFAYKIGYVLDIAHKLIDFEDYRDLFDKYETLEKISFDYAVVEKESSISVMRFSGIWKDLGTWNTLTEAMEDPSIGNVILDEKCENTHAINELDIPIVCMGLKDIVVAASPQGILVAEKATTDSLKKHVEKLDQQVMFAEKSWGSYSVLDVNEDGMTIKVFLKAGNHMNYHSHEHRDEVWTVMSGTGRTIVDGMEKTIKPGDVITMEAGCRHTIFADTDVTIIEIQLGREISVNDKTKFELDI